MKKNSYPLKQVIKKFKDELCAEFYQKASITALVKKLVYFIDENLIKLFDDNGLDQNNQFCLLALGSYGRRELLLHSDIDILLLHDENITGKQLNQVHSFIQDCWDAGLNISHQLTTVRACAELAAEDLTVISSLLDARHLCGRHHLMEELQYQTHRLHMWPGTQFFYAKLEEQHLRHKKFGETAYNLEPNIKNGAGGLRDLQTLLCIGKRHFGIRKLAEGIACGFFTDKEYEELINGQHFLWRVRFALHAISAKQEERLLFDYQARLASIFNYKDKKHSLAIEQFMKNYYSVVKRNRELNEMLLQWFSETIIHLEKQQIIPLDNHFQLSNNFIETRNARIFNQFPPALIAMFLWIAKRPDIIGVRASTIRLLRQHLYLINRSFRRDKTVVNNFLAIFREGVSPFNALQHMNRYGVLGHYLDCFAAVTGQMQYDLFHIYTVDQHSLFVVRNLVRFMDVEHNAAFPLASHLMSSLAKKEILYLAALFHDIGKGRGGDHSEIGAEEAERFAKHHHLSNEDKNLLVWLVRYHLLMSHTAQRQDIYDPKTIQQFCKQLPDGRYLDYLYLLTVADICATNQKLWNSWKDSLLRELYKHARERLVLEQKEIDEQSLICQRQAQALKLLKQQKIPATAVKKIWRHFKGIYFLHESPQAIANHTRAILNCTNFPLVLILPHHSEGGTEVFIYMPHRPERFTISTTVLANNNATIQEATILTFENQFDLDTYIILDEHHQPFTDEKRIKQLHTDLGLYLGNNTSVLPMISRKRVSRTLAHFTRSPQITFADDEGLPITRLFLITADRPGLLAKISRIFSQHNIVLHNAKIATAGERAEDTFYISAQDNKILSEEAKMALSQQLIIDLAN